jgi:hypothetical protein
MLLQVVARADTSLVQLYDQCASGQILGQSTVVKQMSIVWSEFVAVLLKTTISLCWKLDRRIQILAKSTSEVHGIKFRNSLCDDVFTMA